MRIRLCSGIPVAVAVSVLLAWTPSTPAARGRAPRTVTVMGRNLYLGADIYPAIGALIVAPEAVPFVLAGIWDQVEATRIDVRARSLADEIEAALPDLVGIQEAAIWRSQSPADYGTPASSDAEEVEFDILQAVRDELLARGLDYRVAVTVTGGDVERSMFNADLGALQDKRLTVRDAILYRRGAVRVSNARGANFDAAFVLPFTDGAVPLLRSWASVDARVRGRRIRFVSTHLEDPAVHPVAGPFVQGLQARELLDGPADSDLPTIVVGDFNSDPDTTYSPLTQMLMVGSGFTDSWVALHPGDPGKTWDGGNELLDNETFTPDLRLDYVFTRNGAVPVSMEIVGAGPGDRVQGLWPSDHAGTVAVVEIR